jgi:hypothetical protein
LTDVSEALTASMIRASEVLTVSIVRASELLTASVIRATSPDAGGSKYLYNFGQLLRDYTAQYPKWMSSSNPQS